MTDHHARAAERAPAASIVVFRERFELHLHLKDEKRRQYHRTVYPIAVGREGRATPKGPYWVDAKSLEPGWRVPNDPDYRKPDSKVKPGDFLPFEHPDNPFAGGFLSLNDKEGVGIHGTKFPPALGTRASHGCIRMAVKDFEELYPRVPLGTPVTII